MSYGQVAVAILIAPKYLLHLNYIITFTYFRTCDTFGSRFTFKISLRQLPDTLPDLLRRRTLSTVSAQVLYNRIPTIQLSIAGRYYSTATAVIGICRNCISIYIKQKWALAQCLHFIYLQNGAKICCHRQTTYTTIPSRSRRVPIFLPRLSWMIR